MATIGTSGVPSQNTINYDALLSTTLDAYRPVMVDNIFKTSAYLAALKDKGAIFHQNGGERIRCPLMYGDNSTVDSHEGYDVIDTTPQDGITTAFFEWREIAGTISISRREERQNSGEAAILGLLESKVKQAEMTMQEKLNTDLILGKVSGTTFVPATSINDRNSVNPLGWFLRKDNTTDPTAGGNVGNIAGASESWWRHKTAAFNGDADTGVSFSLNATTWKGLQIALKRLHNYASRGAGGAPDLALFDQVSYETYESGLDDKVRYSNTRLADQGFDTIRLKNADCVWDEVVPDVDSGTVAITTGSVFMLNTQFYKLCVDTETDFVTTPFVEPENQTAKVAKVLWMGNTTVDNLRKQAVGYGINQSIVA